MPKKKLAKRKAVKAAKKSFKTPIRDRREHIRVPTQILLDIRPPVPGIDEILGGMIVNLSLGGLAFESDNKLAIGTNVCVTMEKPLALTGKIVHVFPNGEKRRYGVRFTHIGLFSPSKLENHVGLVLKKT